jgi:hypothetical protein
VKEDSMKDVTVWFKSQTPDFTVLTVSNAKTVTRNFL